MGLMDILTLPIRLTVATTQAALGMGALASPDGPLRRKGCAGTSPGGPLDRLLATGGALDRITEQGGVLELLLREQGLADRLLGENGFVEKLTADGGTLDQLLRLGDVLNQLQDSVLVLNRAVGPLGELANRVPSSLLRRRGGESVRPAIASS